MQPGQHFIEQARRLGIASRVLDRHQADTLRDKVETQYAMDATGPLWTRLSTCGTIQNAEAWRWMGEYAGQRAVVVFFDAVEDDRMIEIASGMDLTRVLETCPLFESYSTDLDASYLLCFNHHDFLIAVGGAIPWLEERTVTNLRLGGVGGEAGEDCG